MIGGRKNYGLIGIAWFVLLCWCGFALLANWLPLEPNQIDLNRVFAPPGIDGWLGYDDLGRSLAHRLIAGAQTSFMVAVMVSVVGGLVGVSLGMVAAWLGGWWDHTMVRIMDVLLAFPGILLAIALAGILGPGIENLVIALSVVGWVGFARLARAQTLTVKEREHVHAARALGTSASTILRRHVLPLIAAPLIVELTFGVAAIVVAEAGLSFLGLGVTPPDASWGSMIRDGTRYMLVAPHLVIVPGLAMLLVVLAVNLLGDRLRDRLDVHSRVRLP
jgi:peptide/nickel transport system permease protein